ncbi:MAG TPA: magnesium transporter [Polyangiaceae bacterium]|nr:magnesium transporter [Polyangiaceae bacterium]
MPTLSEYPGPALPIADLRDAWLVLSKADRADGFRILKRSDAEEFFLGLTAGDMAELLHALPDKERRVWVRLLAPDDAADLLQNADPEDREKLLASLDDPTRREVTALMAYAEDEAGGLMNPRFARVRPDMTVDEAVSYLRRQARENLETIYYVYVADEQQHLLGVVSFRELFIASSDKRVRDVMTTNLITVGEEVHQEDVSRLFADEALMAIPVVDPEGRIKGIVTVDDIVDVVQEEATEDAQKFGGMEALEEPYLQIALSRMIKKRGGWLAALFLGEMLTASAMAFFQDEIARAVVLALFVPLIISSGGNSGSQASTLVIRAMALGEVRLRDWWRVVRRELAVGAALGAMLGLIGFVRIVAWQAVSPIYGDHYMRVAQTVFFSLIGVVMFGTIAGSVLPFVLRRVGFDPASASAPFVATLVDVTGLVIYFSVGSLMLRGSLL